MGSIIDNKITKVELIKVEKVFNDPLIKSVFHYNFFFDNIDVPLLVSNPNGELKNDCVGMKLRCKLNDENIVESLEFI